MQKKIPKYKIIVDQTSDSIALLYYGKIVWILQWWVNYRKIWFCQNRSEIFDLFAGKIDFIFSDFEFKKYKKWVKKIKM